MIKKYIVSILIPGMFFLPVSELQSQNVGIGTATPSSSALLDVTSTSKGFLLPRMTAAQRTAIVSPASGLMVYQTDGTAGFYFYNGSTWNQLSTGSPVNYWNANSTHIYNNNSGNVGIGVSSPSYKLSVLGDFLLTGSQPSILINGDATATSSEILFLLPNMNQDYAIRQVSDQLRISRRSSGGAYSFDIALDSFGRVGIGTTAPSARLHVTSNVLIGSGSPATGYLLSVNGKIISEEVRVELDADWPDYVFNEQYHLLPLPKLRAYINRYKHLPGIFSAEEVKRQGGIDLGDMNKRLLEKIEELALYILQLEGRISNMEQTRHKK